MIKLGLHPFAALGADKAHVVVVRLTARVLHLELDVVLVRVGLRLVAGAVAVQYALVHYFKFEVAVGCGAPIGLLAAYSDITLALGRTADA